MCRACWSKNNGNCFTVENIASLQLLVFNRELYSGIIQIRDSVLGFLFPFRRLTCRNEMWTNPPVTNDNEWARLLSRFRDVHESTFFSPDSHDHVSTKVTIDPVIHALIRSGVSTKPTLGHVHTHIHTRTSTHQETPGHTHARKIVHFQKECHWSVWRKKSTWAKLEIRLKLFAKKQT